MARSFKKSNPLTAMTDLNVTPLLDLSFSLLIIFMITTPLLEQTIQVDLPKQDENTSSSRPDVDFQIITLDEAGKIFWGKQPVSLDELNDLLKALSAQDNPPAISFRCDKNQKWQQVVDVLDAIKKNNLNKLHLDTQVK